MSSTPPAKLSVIGSQGTPISSFDGVLPVEYEDLVIGLRWEKFLESVFRRWGVFVAVHPFSVMATSLLISFVLALGVGYWKVTTDPVDLWVSHNSQARQDMEFFNRNFWRFYRIEQVVVSPAKWTNPRLFDYSYRGADGSQTTQTFGPAFNQSFMLQVFRLQKQLESLTVEGPNGRTIRLDDVCFKPLDKDCVTQSIFTYFLEDEALIRDRDYAQRIEVCTR